MVGVTVVCGPWIEGTAAVAHRLASASPAATVVRSTFAPGAERLRRDGVAIVETEPDLAHRTPGCVCCAVRLDVVDVIGTLARRRVPPRHVVVETLPHDDPMCVVQTLLAEHAVQDRVALDALVTVLHGPAVATAAAVGDADAGPHDGAVRVADRVVLDEVDRLTPQGIRQARTVAGSANPLGAIDLGVERVPVSAVLDAGAWTPERLPARLCLGGRGAHPSFAPDGPRHVVIDLPGALDELRVERWLHDLRARCGTRLLRFEAILSLAGRQRRWLATGTRTAFRRAEGDAWGDAPRASLVRLIGDGLEGADLRARLAACVA